MVQHRVEVLGEGQQLVVDGVHPSGVAYAWHGGATATRWRSARPG
jgi:predicted nicotinamide N-methyase